MEEMALMPGLAPDVYQFGLRLWGKGHIVCAGNADMPKTLRDLSRSVEERSRAEGPAAEAELAALRAQARIARIVSERRIDRGLTQQELASLSGIPQSEISKIENARANPTVATLAALARPLGLEITAREAAAAPVAAMTPVVSVSEPIVAPSAAPVFRPLPRLRFVSAYAAA